VNKVSRLCPGDVTADKIIAILGNQSETITSVPSASKKPDEIEDLSFKQLQEITMLAESRIN
jgi:hypothetical protein